MRVRLLVQCQFDVLCIERVALILRPLFALHQFDIQRLCLRLLIKIRAFHFWVVNGTLLKAQLTHCHRTHHANLKLHFNILCTIQMNTFEHSPLPSGSCSSMMALSCLAFNFLLNSTMTQCISVIRLSCADPIASRRRCARSFSSSASFNFFWTDSRSRSECCKRADNSNTSVLSADRAATWSCRKSKKK